MSQYVSQIGPGSHGPAHPRVAALCPVPCALCAHGPLRVLVAALGCVDDDVRGAIVLVDALRDVVDGEANVVLLDGKVPRERRAVRGHGRLVDVVGARRNDDVRVGLVHGLVQRLGHRAAQAQLPMVRVLARAAHVRWQHILHREKKRGRERRRACGQIR